MSKKKLSGETALRKFFQAIYLLLGFAITAGFVFTSLDAAVAASAAPSGLDLPKSTRIGAATKMEE